MPTKEQLVHAAGEMGFPADSLETVWMLVRLLNLMGARSSARLALKGIRLLH